LRFLDDAVRAGKINYIGSSNFTGWQMPPRPGTPERA
jgi:aryl-alcohol dehydrogenase-like predicted oxidoreductase